jgi:hypothetical protein
MRFSPNGQHEGQYRNRFTAIAIMKRGISVTLRSPLPQAFDLRPELGV